MKTIKWVNGVGNQMEYRVSIGYTLDLSANEVTDSPERQIKHELYVDDQKYFGNGATLQPVDDHPVVGGVFGKYGIPKAEYFEIKNSISELKQSDEWIASEEFLVGVNKIINDHEDHEQMIYNAMNP